MLELRINQPMATHAAAYNPIYPSTHVPIVDPFAMPMASTAYAPFNFTPNNVPIIKKYNISLGNFNGDLAQVAAVYEDVLPKNGQSVMNTYNTVRERLGIHSYVRGIFIRNGDGENIQLGGGNSDGTSGNSMVINLLQHIKLLGVNPHHSSPDTFNVFKTTPANFLSYQSCYPIQLNQANNQISCHKDNLGIHIRIYLLSKLDELVHKDADLNKHRNKSDIYRELYFYQYIKDMLVRPGACPNFAMMYAYYHTSNQGGIDFRKFRGLQQFINNGDLNQRTINNEVMKVAAMNGVARMLLHFDKLPGFKVADFLKPKMFNGRPVLDKHRRPEMVLEINDADMVRMRVRYLDMLRDGSETVNDVLYGDRCLIMLTESFTENIYDWSTRTYQVDSGPVRKMVKTGYHTPEAWQSVLFQLLMALLAMMEHELAFREFALESNVYIKDLKADIVNLGLWKYVHNGVTFYVPNYGDLVLIDSSFKELQSQSFETRMRLGIKASDLKNRFLARALVEPLSSDESNASTYMTQVRDLYEAIRQAFIQAFSFNFDYQSGMVRPEDAQVTAMCNEIVKHVENITLPKATSLVGFDDAIKKVREQFRELPMKVVQFAPFVHNRVGTPVREGERQYVGTASLQDSGMDQLKAGDIVAVRRGDGNHQCFAVFLKVVDRERATCSVLTTNNIVHNPSITPVYKQQDVHFGDVMLYHNYLEQAPAPGKQTTELDTYKIDIITV